MPVGDRATKTGITWMKGVAMVVVFTLWVINIYSYDELSPVTGGCVNDALIVG